MRKWALRFTGYHLRSRSVKKARRIAQVTATSSRLKRCAVPRRTAACANPLPIAKLPQRHRSRPCRFVSANAAVRHAIVKSPRRRQPRIAAPSPHLLAGKADARRAYTGRASEISLPNSAATNGSARQRQHRQMR